MLYIEFYEHFQNRLIEEHIRLSARGYEISSMYVRLNTFRFSNFTLLIFQSDIGSIKGFTAPSKTDDVCLYEC